jgi:lysyl-tRNA synthetase, class II
MEDENKLIQERIKKLNDIKEQNINPYAYSFKGKSSSKEIKEKFKDLKREEECNEKIRFAGRIMAMRNMGKASFIHIQDGYGKLQIYLNQDKIGKEKYKFLKKIDIGDFIGLEGIPFITKTGELTLNVEEYELLTKTIRPLPEKFHGLKDPELRFRKKYLDLIMNPEVKEIYIKRAKIYKAIRQFLDERGYIEVQTPILQTMYGGANAKPFETKINAYNMPMYLRIAYELHLKRLMVGGFEKVYDLSSCFRNEGVDKTHNPEFAMMEIQTAWEDYEYTLELVEKLWEFVAIQVTGSTKIKFGEHELDFKTPWTRISMKDAIKKYGNIDVDALNDDELYEIIEKFNLKCDKVRGLMIAEIFEEVAEKHLIQPTHIIDHPIETCPLAKTHRNDKTLIERCESFAAGFELGNYYTELTDPQIQREHFEEQVERGRGGDDEAHPMDEDYIESLEYGLPPNAGIGIGIERMVMLITGQDSIREIILFPIMKPKKEEEKNV